MTAPLESLYQKHLASKIATAEHLPTLRRLAEGCDVCVELGCRTGASAVALLLGAQSVVSYDIRPTEQSRALQRLTNRWLFLAQDSRFATLPECDLLFIDSLHTYAQCRAELEAHADKVQKYLVFHDTLTFGSVGADGETGKQSWTYRQGVSVPQEHLGIRPAIDELMIRDQSWVIEECHTNSHGLLVLRRIKDV